MNDFDWTSLINPALQAGANYWASKQVGKAGERAAGQADPFAQYRPQYANALAELQRDPSRVRETPGYRFAFDQGQQALERSAAAKGFTGSGNVLTELVNYGQGMAEQQFGKERDFLAKASGAYLDPSVAARMGLDSRMTQLGGYNQAAGELMSGAGGGTNSLATLYKTGKGLYDAYKAGSALTGGSGTTAAGSVAGGSGGGLIAGGEFGAGQTAGNYLMGSGVGTEGGVVGSSLYGPTATEAAIDSGSLGAGSGAGEAGAASTAGASAGTLSAGQALGGAGAVYAIGNALMNYADSREAASWVQNTQELINQGRIPEAREALQKNIDQSIGGFTPESFAYAAYQSAQDAEANFDYDNLWGPENPMYTLATALFGKQFADQKQAEYKANKLNAMRAAGKIVDDPAEAWRLNQASVDNSGGG